MAIEILESRTLLSNVSWTGAGDGTNWTNPSNWSDDAVPGPGAVVTINVTGAPTIKIASGTQSIQSLTCSDPLSITGGSLTVSANSTIGDGMAMTGGSLTANGSGISLTVTGTTTISGASLYADAGATLSLPALISLTSNSSTFQADGAGSVLNVSALTNVTQQGTLYLNTLAGGTLNLGGLTSLTSTKGITVQDTGGSTLLDGKLTSLSRVGITLDGTGTMQTSQWESLTNGSLTINGGDYSSTTSPPFASLSNIDGSNISVEVGTLALPAVTSMSINPSDYGPTTFQVENDGSLSLPGLTAISSGNPVTITSSGMGSEIDLPELSSIVLNSYDGSLSDTDGGTVLDGNLTSLNGVRVALDGTGTIQTSQWTTLTNGSLTIGGGDYSSTTSPPFANLADIDGSSVSVEDGGSLTLPAVATYTNSSNYAFTSPLIATGVGTTLNLPYLTSLSVEGFDTDVAIQALQGGQTLLPSLVQITVSSAYSGILGVLVDSDGSGSLIDLSSLTSFSGGAAGSGLTIADGGAVLDPNLTTFANVTITTDPTTTFTVPADQTFSFPNGLTTINTGAVVDEGDLALGRSEIFTLANYPGGGTGIIQTPGQSNPSAFDIAVSITDPSTVFTLINSAYGVYGDTVGEVEFKATGGLDFTVNLVEGQNIRDHNNGGYNDTIGQGALGGTYVGSAYYDGSQVRLDEQEFVLPSSFNSATLTDIILHGYGNGGEGDPFLAAATVATTNGPDQVNINSYVNANLKTYANGSNYPLGGSLVSAGNATVNVQGGLTIDGQGGLSVSSVSTLQVSGNLLGNTINAAGFNPLGTVKFDGTGTTSSPQLLEVMSQDLGNVATGFDDNFAYGTLQLTANTYVELVDDAANSPGNTPEALYVNDLIVPAGATLNLDGLHLYVHTEQINGTIVAGGAVVSGEVFDDVNGNGSLDNGEPGLAGWTVDLTNTSSNSTYTTTTDVNGLFSLTGIAAGTYILSEVVQPGFAQTAPASPGTYTITVASGQTVGNENFGDHLTATVGGEVFIDTNGNGLLNGGEPGLSGWTVNLLNNSNQVIGTATTDASGNFSFTSLAPGTYTVQVVSQSGYVASSAASVTITDDNGQADTVNFGQFVPVTISGEVFGDLNDSGIIGANDPGLSGWNVNLINGSHQVVQTATTDSNGVYSFPSVGPGTYTLADVLQSGYVQTAPITGTFSITPTSGVNVSGENFGATQETILSVTGLAVSPAVLQSGASLVVQWNDTNTGISAAVGSFYDQVVITNTTTGQQLASSLVQYNAATLGDLAAGASAPQRYDFSLPNGNPGVGQIQFTVTADYYGDASTGQGATNKVASLTETSQLASYPDLTVSDVSAVSTASPGQQVSVGWTLANNGAATASGPWTEQILLATDAAGDNPTLLTAQTFSGSLPAGQSVARSTNVQVPDLPPGNYWFVVSENPFGAVFELNTSNNLAVSTEPISIAGGLTLTLSAQSVSDAAGPDATKAIVTRNTDTTNPLQVTITNSDPNDVSVPQTVTIPAGATSVTFPVGTINNHVVEGTQTATLTASATGEVSGSDTITVTDTNVPTLTVVLNSHSVNETDPNPATYGTVTRNTPTTSALTVSLLSNEINKLTVPATVTIPAGSTSATFPVTVVNDHQIDGNESATFTASASGFQAGSDTAVVVDDNSPTLSLTLAEQTVSEAAGADATTGTVSIASPASQPITISLNSSAMTVATVPTSVVIDAGQTSASFPIAAIDNSLNTTNETATITANVETDAGVIVVQGSAEASLVLENVNGPALSLSFGTLTVEKGTTATGTITRNTDTTGSLVITLSSSDPTKATVPPTVTIPAGQTSVSFAVNTINNQTPGGLQHVQIFATATGLDTGIATLGITDVDLPDLVVSSVTAPSSVNDNSPLNISWTVTNTGQYPASGSWVDQIDLDPVGGPQSTTPADSVTFTGTVNAGQSYTQTDTIPSPSVVGPYIVRVVTDSGQSVQELSFSNNTGVAAQPVNDQAAYNVTVSPSATTVSSGTPIVLSGVATMTSNSAPAADVPVAVQILVAGTTRTLTATTDSTGHYSVTFQPLPNEAGEYSVTAADPGVSNPAVQAQFEIVGMTASPATAKVTIDPNTPLTGTFTLTNLSTTTLTGLTATASGGPSGLTVRLTPPSQIAGDGTATLGYSLDDTSTQAASGVVTIQVTTTQGAVLSILVGVTVAPLTPVLVANPGFLNSGMVVGTQSLVSFTVVNNGGAPSGNLQVSLPTTSYMTLASPATIPSLAPGASTTVTVELTPPSNLPLEEYKGTIGIGGSQIGISVPFTFTAITTATGDVHVLVDDDYTFDEAGSPRVQGATVNLLNPYDNTEIVETGTTDATGAVTFSDVPAGPYDLQVTAPGHSSYDNSFTVVSGITNSDEVFIQRQFVTYTWNVVQTTIQDTYQIQLQTTFATDVPAPIVTITAPSSIPTLVPGQSWTFNATITNHGLIAAQGVKLTMPTDPEYTFTALSTDIGVVPAESSVEIPITVTRVAPQSVSASQGGTDFSANVVVPSPVQSDTASTVYVDYSNTGTVAIPAPILVLTASQGSSQGAFLSLDSAQAGLGYNSNSTPAGFNNTVQFLASGAMPGMIEPGESVRIPVYYGGWLSSQWSSAPVTFSLNEAGTDDTDAIDWSTVAPGLQPISINAAAWSAISPILATQMGSTWGRYVQTLDNDAAYLAGIGDPTTDISQLLSFELEKANAAFIPQTLADVTPDSLPAPGMDLTFVQSFQASIAGRYTMGILGYGWTNNWDTTATTMFNGDVIVEEDGISRYFSLQPNGSFAPEAGDEGTTLTISGGAYQLVETDGTTYQFNVNGTLNYVQDTHGNRITAGHNAQGQLDSLTDSNGEYLDLAYNAQGHLATLSDSNGQTETYGYDRTGQFLTSFTNAYGTTTYSYVTGQSAAQNNALATITNAAGTETFFGYDSDGRLIDVHENGGAEDETISYLNPGGYVTTDADGNPTTVYFNLFNAAAVTIDPLGNVTRASYDSNLNLTKVVGPDGINYSYTYDANGNLTSETDPLGLTTSFTYNASNDLTSYTDAKGNTTSYAYNAQNDLLSITYANGTQQSYTYNPLGEATQYLNADSQAIGYTYNAQGLVATENFADGTSYSYTYDAQGNLTSATDAQGNVTTFLYGNPTNPDLLTEVEYPDGTWLKFSYNIVGQRTQSVDQTGFTTTYAYDALGRLSELTDGNGNLIVLYTYDADGNLIQKDNGNGTRTVYTYDAVDDVLSITNYAPDHFTANSFDDYTYDALGNVLTDTSQDGEWVYSYDADSQLIQAIFTLNSTDPDGLTAQDLQYVYDATGNRISETVNGVTTTYVTNNVNEYTSSTTNGVTTTYQYDAAGNLIAQVVGGSATTTYTFNELNELTAVNGPRLTANYGYDALGNRISQMVNGVVTSFQIDPTGLGNVVATFSVTGALIAHYTYGLGLVSQVSATGTVGYYDFNSIGSTVGITGSSGTYVNTYNYLPFGQTTTLTATVANPFTFAGQVGVTQAAPNLLGMGARDYSPVTGQFLSNDPAGLSGGDLNIRRYVANNPATYVDPSGLAYGHWEHQLWPWPGHILYHGPDGTYWGYDQDGGAHQETAPDLSIWFPIWEGRLDDASMQEAFKDAGQNGDWTADRFRFLWWTGHGFNFDFGGEFCHDCIDYHDAVNPPPGGGGGGAGCPTQKPYNPAKPPGGPCTLVIGLDGFYICDNIHVPLGAVAAISVPGRFCTALGVASAVAGIWAGFGGGGGIPPAVVGAYNCNQFLNTLLQALLQTLPRILDPPIDTAQAVTSTGQAANAVGTDGNVSPLTFVATALGNLGLINGQSGNDGYAPAEAAQMVSTIATFDQVEADLAGILETASGEGASLGIAGDIALLQQVDGRLEAVTVAENSLFGGDANWLDTNQAATLQQWMTAFFTDAQNASDGTISAADMTQLLATTLPSSVSTSEAMEFLDRWNRTVRYWSQGIFTAAQVPSGQSTDFLDIDAIQTAFNAAVTAEQESEVDGYSDVGAEAQGALTQVESDLEGQGVCATIKLQIDQTATLTRSAFSGTLTITNSEGTGPMTNVVMDINITDAEGNPANGEFYVSSPGYSGAFSVVNGIATLPDDSTGTITFTFIPDDTAASSGPTQYSIGGTIGFTDPSGGAVTIPVFPSTITVNPQPELQLNYFLQTDVIGEDPFTPDVVIPSEPAVLGLLVTNVGGGTANNLSITTAQPQIVQNEKGLLDTFQIIGTQVGNQQETPSLTVNFGDIAPGQTADASFLILSSLEGLFENFTASFSHSDALGGTATSLITSVVTHTLVHAGDFNYPDSTGAKDYLVDDNPNPQGLPDTIYFSDGTTATVNIAKDAASSPVGPSSALTFQVTASVTSGWDYIQLPDPGAGYTLYKVVRSDGTVIPVSDQAWTTDRTISPSGASSVDYELHILDDNSTGSYLVYYKPTTATPPAVSSISTVSSPQSGPVGSVNVTFSEPIDPSTFTTANLSLTLNGGPNLINSSVTITQDSPTTFTIGGLSALTANDGNYTLTVNAAGISDFFGDVGTGTQSTAWATGTNVPVVVSVGAGNPTLRNTPVDTVDVVLSEPIDPSSFDYQALTLTLNGGSNLITSGVTVTEIDPTNYQIGGLAPLTAVDGNYVLTVTAAGLSDQAGHSGVGLLSESWVLNTVGPTVASLPTYIQSPRNIVVPSIDVIFSEPIVPISFTYQNLTYSKEGGPNLINPSITITQLSPTEFEIANFNNLILPIDGTYTFTVSAAGVMDLAGNTGTGSASDTWVLATSAPAAPTDLAVSSNIGTSPGLTDTGMVTLTGTLPESGLAVDVVDGNTDLGFATVNGTSFSITANLPAGANQLEVTTEDAAGNLSPSSTINVFVGETPLEISSIAGPAPNSRNSAVGSIDVTFTAPINTATFTTADLTLTDNGGPNLITSDVTMNLVSGSTYEIDGLSSLTTAEGTYTLTINASGIQDEAGNFGTGSMSTTWLMDTTPPTSTVASLPSQTTSTSFLVSATGSDPSGSNGSMPSGIASFAIDVSTDGVPFTLFATVTPSNPSALFTGQAGDTYSFYSVATDNAGNVQPTPTEAQASTTVKVAHSQQTTSLSAVSGSGTYAGTATLTATLTVGGAPLAGETVAFTLTSGGTATSVGSATTNANGVATLAGVSLSGFDAGKVSGAVGASFAGDDSNAASSASGDLTVSPAQATLTPSGLVFTYDGASHTVTITTSPANLSGVTVTYSQGSTTVAAPTSAGTYEFTALLTNPNYTAPNATGTLVINPATPSITWGNPAAITYGTPLSASQLDAMASVPGKFVYTPASGMIVDAGSQTLSMTFTPTDATDYQSVTAQTTLVVNPATPTITWPTPAAITYGTPLSATQLDATAKIEAWPLAGTYTYSPALGAIPDAGSHTLSMTFTPTDAIDHTSVTTQTTLVVNPATPTMRWAAPAAITYGTPLSAAQLDATAKIEAWPLAGTFTYSPALGTILDAGPHTLSVTFTPTDAIDHKTVTAQTTLVVNASTPTITWPNPAAITYGTRLSTSQLDAIAKIKVWPLAGTYTYSPALGTILSAGSHMLSVTFTPTDAIDHKIVTSTTEINVRPASLTVTVNNATRFYGQATPTFTTSYRGFVNGQGPSALAGSLAFRTTAVPSSNVGSYPVQASGLSSPNYTISYVPGTLSIDPAVLTFTAVNKVKKFKARNPRLTFTESGFVLGQTAKEILRGVPVLSTTATRKSPVGQYAIVVRRGTLRLTDENYTFKFVNGILQVIGKGSK